jgi:hypothetical protein
MEVLMVDFFVNTVASGRETSAMGKASHRGHGGEWRFWRWGLLREHRCIGTVSDINPPLAQRLSRRELFR